jgi:penicillin-binding protein-related factor A (putative recombinase)
MPQPESIFWHRIRDSWNKAEERAEFTRIENSAGAGVPDVEAFFEAQQLWFELKVARRAGKQTFSLPHLKPKQVEWLHNRSLAGGKAFLVVKADRFVGLVRGTDAREMFGKRWGLKWLQGKSVREHNFNSNLQELLAAAAHWT